MCNCPYCNKGFSNWKSVRGHISKCKLNTKDYVICEYYGPISFEVINSCISLKHLKSIYPNISFDSTYYSKLRNEKLINIKRKSWIKTEVIDIIQKYFEKNGKIPESRYFLNNPTTPGKMVVQQLFGSFNKAIEAAGFTASIQNGFGINTYGKDGILYDSGVEAYFVDNFLFEKYQYEYYKPYGNGWYFDFYLPQLDLYIEIDGELPENTTGYRTKMDNKIQFCKDNNLKLKVFTKDEIYKKDFALETFKDDVLFRK